MRNRLDGRKKKMSARMGKAFFVIEDFSILRDQDLQDLMIT